MPWWATDWIHALKKQAYAALLRCLRETRAYLRIIASTGSDAGAHKPSFFACGIDSFANWFQPLALKGHILERRDGRLQLIDQSAEPNFTLNQAFAREMLAESPDKALLDAVTTHGIVFFDKLAPQLVIAPPMLNLAEGLSSVLAQVEKMAEAGWFSIELADGLDDGVVSLRSLPGRFQSAGTVPRALSDERRLIVNNSYPHERCWTTVGHLAPVYSLNGSIGAQGDRDRRGPAVAAAAVLRPYVPRAYSVQALAARAPYAAPLLITGSGGEAAVLPRELKPFFWELLLSLCILSHVGEIFDLPVIFLGDDFAKFFHQFVLARTQRWTSQLLMLDTATARGVEQRDGLVDKVLASFSTAELAVVEERCMSMGTSPSSSYAQRYTTELCNYFTRSFHSDHADRYRAWAGDSAAFAAWLEKQERLGRETGKCETLLLVAFAYTDDPVMATLGTELAVDAAMR